MWSGNFENTPPHSLTRQPTTTTEFDVSGHRSHVSPDIVPRSSSVDRLIALRGVEFELADQLAVFAEDPNVQTGHEHHMAGSAGLAVAPDESRRCTATGRHPYQVISDRGLRRDREGGGDENGPAPEFAPAFLTGNDD